MRLAASLLLLSWIATAAADSHVPPPPPRDRRAPPPVQQPHTVIARLVGGERPIIACGVIAYIGVYVYEVERTESGAPITGRITVDVLCPDFYRGKVRFKLGERHRIDLGRARRTYAGATPRPSPQPDTPRFEGKNIASAAP